MLLARHIAAPAALALPLPAHASPPLPSIPARTFAASAYGAAGDGTTDNTTVIQKALDDAAAAGGGTVELGAAPQPFLCGPITIHSGTNLQIDAGATLQALPFGTYPNSTSSPSHFITVATGSTNVEISGGGIINGDGAAWWNAYNLKQITNRPRLIQVNHTDTFRITGITIENSPMFHVAFSATNNVTIDGVTITAPSSAPNTDAIDPAGLHYLITGCTVSVGDDDVAVKAGSTACGDITVTHCGFGAGHGVSIGGQTNAGVDGMTVDSCTFDGTTTALRMKADPTQGGLVQNITYSDLTMTRVAYPFVIYSYYREVGSPGATGGSSQTTPAKAASWNASPPDPLTSATIPIWRNITLRNITATGATGYSVIWGLPLANALVSNVTLDNVHVTGNAGLEVYNATGIQFTNGTSFTVPSGSAPLTTYNALAITGQPQSQTLPTGADVTLAIATAGASGVDGALPSVQWTFSGAPLSDGTLADGTIVAGAASPTLTLRNVQPAEAGPYAVRVTNKLDTFDAGTASVIPSNTPVDATSVPAQVAVGAASTEGRIINLSLLTSLSADETVTFGFFVGGSGTVGGKPLLMRAMGPSLAPFNVPDPLADPYLAFFDGSTQVSRNDDWGGDATISAVADRLQAFPFISAASKDAAIYDTDVTGGSSGHSLQITGKGGSGNVLAELYDATPDSGLTAATPRLINVSCLKDIGAMTTVGFYIGGATNVRLLIRAVGPGIARAPFNVQGTMADPMLTLHGTVAKVDTVLASNDDWGGSADLVAAAAAVGAFPLDPASKDAALLETLAPGGYTVQVSTATGSTGVALIEVYEVP